MKAAALLLWLASLSGAASADWRAAADAQLRDNASAHGIPAQVVFVQRPGEPVYRFSSGTLSLEDREPVTAQSVFNIFSVSKLFASTLVLQLAEQGRIDLAAPASRYVAGLPPAWSGIRVEQFLSHVSGVPEYFDGQDLSKPFPRDLNAVFTALRERPLDAAPGERTRYTQTNYLVLEAMLEAVTGTPYRRLVRERLLQPLGLRDTWLDAAEVPAARRVTIYKAEAGRAVPEPPVAWPDYAIAHAGVHATADDLGRFLSALAQGRLLSRDALLRHWQPYRFASGKTGFFASGWDYGESAGWHEVGHDGGTKVRVRILFADSLERPTVIVYLTNGNRDEVWSRTLVDSIQGLLPKP